MARAHALKFKGKYDEDGKPDRFVYFAPARDLDDADIANLSDAEYRDITSGDKPLYAEVKKPEEKTSHPAPKPGANEKKPEAEAGTPKQVEPSPEAPRGT